MKRSFAFGCLCVFLASAGPAQGGTKEEIMRLQSDVLAMQNQLRLMEKTFTERTDGIRTLVAQLNDQVAQSNQLMGKLSKSMESQSSGDKSVGVAVLQEIRNLSTKIDDSAMRISALAQQIAAMKVQAKPVSQRTYQSAGQDSAALALSADTIYNEAFNDLVQGSFDLAIEGFTSFVKNFPTNEKADDAEYNIGEAYYNQNKMQQAVSAFTRVLQDYPGGDKVPSALFKRAKAELALQERDNAVQDLKTVIQKYPSSPEANLARNELEAMGVNLSKPSKPATRARTRR